MSAIEFSRLSKSYPIYSSAGQRLKELATLNSRSFHTDYWALRDITFSVNRGETFCIVGENGSGKSTLLQICAGILEPTEGAVTVTGRVSALLVLGAGFNPEFTGRDNVYLNGAILGFSRKEMEARFPEIEAFAEIGEFIDLPVKTYSSGMIVRLAFAVAIHVDPEILLVDEALAVGDVYFRQRCMRKVHELRSKGITIIFVSHSTGDIKALGDRALWLEHGRMMALGDTDIVVSKYLAAMTAKDSRYLSHDPPKAHEPLKSDEPQESIPPPEIVDSIPNIDHRFGDGRADILGIAAFSPEGARLSSLQPSSTMVVRISVRAKTNIDHPIVGFMFRNHLGVDFAGTNTARERHDLPPMMMGETCTVDFYIDLPAIYASLFSFSPAVADGSLDHYAICDWIDNALVLPMERGDAPVYGQVHFPCRVQVNTRLNSGVSNSGVLAS